MRAGSLPASFHGLRVVNCDADPAGNSRSAARFAVKSCGWSLGLRNVMIAFSGDHAAHPYTSRRAGSPPIQWESFNVGAFSRDHFAVSASTSQSAEDSNV